MDSKEFPPNSHTSAKPDPEKKVTQVTTSDVRRRKPSLGRRFMETFVVGNTQNVAQYVAMEVIVPAIKDVATDVISTMVERLLYGEGRGGGRRPQRSGTSPAHVPYNRYQASTPGPWSPSRRPAPTTQSAPRPVAFDEVIVASRVEAEDVIEGMELLVEKYGQVTVHDVYQLVGLKGDWTDDRWGWTNVSHATIRRVQQGGYLIVLEKPIALD